MTYQYARRPADFLSYNCLDFNEYQGEIPDSPALNPERFRHYPLTDDPSLLKALASLTSFPQKNLALTAGADEALFHSLLFLKLRRGLDKGFLFFQPSYDHAACFMKTLGFSVSGPWPEVRRKPPAAAPPRRVRKRPPPPQGISRSVVYLASPDNPTGREVPPAFLEELIRKSPQNFWLLDMTYIHYSARFRISDYKSLLLNNKNAAIVLSLSKGFPLAGLRIGALASADEELLKYFGEEYNKKSVNAAGRAAALQCLEKESFYKEQRRQILRNKPLLAAALLKEAARLGLRLKPKNFVCFETEGPAAGEAPALDPVPPPVKTRPAETQTDSQALSNLADEAGNFFCLAGSAGDLQKFTEHLYSKKIIVRYKKNWDFLRVTSVSDSRLQKIKKQLCPT